MPRLIEVTVPCERSAELIRRAGEIDQVLGLRLQPGASLRPPPR